MKCIGVFDIDGCITDLSYYSFLFKREKTVDFNPTYLSNKLLRTMFFKFMCFMCINYKLQRNVKDVIDRLKDNVEIDIVTKRYFACSDEPEAKVVRDLTKYMLEKESIYYDSIEFTNGLKVEECLNLKADFVVEDSPTNIRELSKYLPVIVINTVYNQGISGDNIYRVNNWLELEELINKKFAYKKLK